jgi:hypothetical protein
MGNIKQGKPKGASGKAELIAREAEIIKLRRGGLTWDMIAERVGYSSGLTARAAYMRGMSRYVAPDVNEIRQLESERLDIAQSAVWGEVLKGDTQAIMALMRIMDRRAKLFGLDAPKDIHIKAEVGIYDRDTIDGEVRRLITLLAGSPQGSLDTQPSQN